MKRWTFLLIGMLLILSAIGQKNADLAILKIERPKWNDSTRIFITIINLGGDPSKEVILKVWDVDISLEEAKAIGVQQDKWWIFEENRSRSENGENDYDTYFEVLKKIPALGNGQTIRVEVNVKHWIYDSNCEIGAYIDCYNTQVEKDEKNNKSYFFEGG
jgi:hypothetical protein